MLLKNDHIRHVSGYQILNVGYAVVETTTVTCSNGDRIRPIGVGVGNLFQHWDNSRRKCLRSLFLQILTWCETLLEQSRAVWRHSFGILAFKVLVLILTCTVKKHLGYFSHIFRLPQLHQCDQCDQGMLPNRFSWKSNEEVVNFAINSQRKVPFSNSHRS